MNRRILEAEDGFTLAEVLTAMAVLVVGLVAVALAFHYALTGIETGRGETTAAFLAERALEELKAVALVDWGSAALAPATRIEYCLPAGDACTRAATPGSYRRATTISDAQNGPATEQPRCGAPGFPRCRDGPRTLGQGRGPRRSEDPQVRRVRNAQPADGMVL